MIRESQILHTSESIVSDDEDIEGVVDKAVRAAVGDILDMEKKALSQLNTN